MRKLVYATGWAMIVGGWFIPVGCASVLRTVHVQTPVPIILISMALMAAVETAGIIAISYSLSRKYRFPDER